MLLSFSIGPFSISAYAAFTVFFIFVFWAVARLLTRKNESPEDVSDNIFRALVIGVVAARAVFVLSFWEVYQQDLFSVIDIRDGGFNTTIGWFSGLLILLACTRNKREHMSAYLKAAVMAAVIIAPLALVNLLLTNEQSIWPIQLQRADGTAVMVEHQTGKPVVINFWASWCPPCRREMPVLVEAQNDYADITFIFVNQQDSTSDALHFLRKNNLEIANIYFDPVGQTARQLGISGLPSTLFFDANGNLVTSHMGEVSRASLLHNVQQLVTDSAEK